MTAHRNLPLKVKRRVLGADALLLQPLSRQRVCAQAAAALKARTIMFTEEKQIQSLISQVVKRQLTKLQSKLANFEKVRLLRASKRAYLFLCLTALAFSADLRSRIQGGPGQCDPEI